MIWLISSAKVDSLVTVFPSIFKKRFLRSDKVVFCYGILFTCYKLFSGRCVSNCHSVYSPGITYTLREIFACIDNRICLPSYLQSRIDLFTRITSRYLTTQHVCPSLPRSNVTVSIFWRKKVYVHIERVQQVKTFSTLTQSAVEKKRKRLVKATWPICGRTHRTQPSLDSHCWTSLLRLYHIVTGPFPTEQHRQRFDLRFNRNRRLRTWGVCLITPFFSSRMQVIE